MLLQTSNFLSFVEHKKRYFKNAVVQTILDPTDLMGKNIEPFFKISCLMVKGTLTIGLDRFGTT